jgi:MFS transporter, DHA2 family, multidrug resistance protein
VVGVSFAVGPTIASLVLSVGPWPWLFAINIPLGLLALAFSVHGLPRTAPGAQRLDPLAALLNIVTFATLGGALIAVAQRAGAAVVFGAMASTLVFGALLLRRESGRSAPMLPIDLFGRPVFTLSTITAIAAFATQGLAFVSLPFYFEGALHRSQIETGFLLTPWSAVVALISPLGGRLADRYAPAIPCAIGLAMLSAGMVSLAMLPAQPLAVEICVRMAICGAGFSLFQSPNLKALMGSVPAARSGGANGVISSARLLGQASGAALVALSFQLAGAHGPMLALFTGAGFAALAAVTSALRLLAERPATCP